MGSLSGKIAVVTGASKGIGAAIAKHLGAAGVTVVVNYSSSKEGADDVVAEIVKAGGKAVALGASFADPEAIQGFYAEVKKQFGKLDILVNNAGIYEMGPLEAVTVESFHRQFNLNVLGLVLSTQAAVPLFSSEGGSIINIGSVVGTMAGAMISVYAGTKGAVNAITIALSKELGARKIRVNALNPGMVETEGTAAAGFLGSDFEKLIANSTPLGRIGQPADIGKIAVFLASEDSFWVNGQLLNAAGGQTM